MNSGLIAGVCRWIAANRRVAYFSLNENQWVLRTSNSSTTYSSDDLRVAEVWVKLNKHLQSWTDGGFYCIPRNVGLWCRAWVSHNVWTNSYTRRVRPTEASAQRENSWFVDCYHGTYALVQGAGGFRQQSGCRHSMHTDSASVLFESWGGKWGYVARYTSTLSWMRFGIAEDPDFYV